MTVHDDGDHNADLQAAWERKTQDQEDDLADIEAAFPDTLPVRGGWRAVIRSGHAHRILQRCAHTHNRELDAMECGADLHKRYLDEVLRPQVRRSFTYTVTVVTDTPEHAMQVMAGRCNHDEWYGFDYSLSWR